LFHDQGAVAHWSYDQGPESFGLRSNFNAKRVSDLDRPALEELRQDAKGSAFSKRAGVFGLGQQSIPYFIRARMQKSRPLWASGFKHSPSGVVAPTGHPADFRRSTVPIDLTFAPPADPKTPPQNLGENFQSRQKCVY